MKIFKHKNKYIVLIYMENKEVKKRGRPFRSSIMMI